MPESWVRVIIDDERSPRCQSSPKPDGCPLETITWTGKKPHAQTIQTRSEASLPANRRLGGREEEMKEEEGWTVPEIRTWKKLL